MVRDARFSESNLHFVVERTDNGGGVFFETETEHRAAVADASKCGCSRVLTSMACISLATTSPHRFFNINTIIMQLSQSILTSRSHAMLSPVLSSSLHGSLPSAHNSRFGDTIDLGFGLKLRAVLYHFADEIVSRKIYS